MQVQTNPPWAELIQLIPVVSLALPLIIAGQVDLARAESGFLLGSVLFVGVSAALYRLRLQVNVIALGTGVWMLLGASAFLSAWPTLLNLVVSMQGSLLFGVVLLIACGLLTKPLSWLLSVRGGREETLRPYALILVAACAACFAWAWVFRYDVRIGGGLPFILLNVVRRVLIARVSKAA